MKRYDEDEIPTRPDVRNPHSDIHGTVGLLMAESQNHRKRIEVLERLALRTKGALDSVPPTAQDRYIKVIATTIKWAILVIAGLISALRELGYLAP